MTEPRVVTRPRVCVVGLGNLGGGVARRLVDAGYAPLGYDAAPRVRQSAADAGVAVRATLPDAVGDADVVLTSLPDGAAVREVWLGPDGLVAQARPGTFLVELSTIGPDTMREVAGPAERAGLRAVDAPVSGGPVEAANGALVIILGGAPADIEELGPLWRDLGQSVHVAGPVGAAKTVKLVNNLITNATVLVSAEAFHLGVAAGLAPEHLFALLSEMGGGKSHHFQKRFPWALDDDFRARFSIDLADKDFRLGLRLGELTGVPLPAATAMRSVYAIAKAEGLGQDDIVGLLQLYRRWTAVGG
jgi:3-hydroxyisobutyrate dehydrogenase